MGDTESTMQGEPEPGDMIGISLGINTHWALYVGGGNVIHLTERDEASGVSYYGVPSARAKKGLVKKEPLAWVVGMKSFHVRKYDTKYNRRSRREILRGAEAMVGTWVDYDHFAKNCELFAPECRYQFRPEQRSKPVETGLSATTAIGAGLGLLAVAAVAAAVFDTPKTQKRK